MYHTKSDLWGLVESCWTHEPSMRPTAGAVQCQLDEKLRTL